MKTLFLLSIFCITCILPASSQCLDDQKSLLLGLRNSLIFNLSASKKLVHWNHNIDCCNWDGVECDVLGHVISLQLDQEMISSGIENSEYLFNLSYLEKLNLASNKFNKIQIPKGISNLANLTHLNLSCAGFAGQVPHEVLRLKKLASLDLSAFVCSHLFTPFLFQLYLENPNLKMLVQNLKELKELYLDAVAISAQGNNWCHAISSSLPDLRILSLRSCHLSGPIVSSLLELPSLSVLRLDHNDLASAVPDFSANFSGLTTLSLASCSLLGSFPEKVFEMLSLQNLDLSDNMLLSGTLPNFTQNGSLRTMVIRGTNFSGSLPDSISNLSMLSNLDLSSCSFIGQIPSTIGNLTELTYLDISSNNFNGSIPLFRLSKKLTYIDASHNSLTGNIPSSLFALPSLTILWLSDNEFHGQVQELSNLSSSLLEELDVRHNHLEGPIPKFFSELEQLKMLLLSSNKFKGTVQLEMFKNPHLDTLDLSHNDLFVQSTDSDSSLLMLPNVITLILASCKLQRFPSLHRQPRLFELDLSSNQLKGEIPNWIWEIGNGSLGHLNLSNNLLHGFQKPYKFPSLYVLDLHSNQLLGELPIPPLSSYYVDYSHNYFTNSVPNDIGHFLSRAHFFFASNNNLTGEIPPSICSAYALHVLDLSANALTGGIPPCLPYNISRFGVLSLGRNNLSGTIPDTFSVNCKLQTLDLNKNVLTGKIPRSLGNCESIEILNIGNNRIEETFPCMLMKTSLRVLILRSNKLYGDLQCLEAIQEWLNLQIIDISTNNFSGGISFLSFSKWRGMISANNNKQSKYNHLRFDFFELNGRYYQDAVTVSLKGLEMELKKILIIFTSIDFSNNKFHGEIPYSIGDLKSLYGLNLSHNELTGSIPTSIGNLTQLGFLDLSVNKLTGKIPVELASLTFISFLNLSYNRLFGEIPEGPQFRTFLPASFEGNLGLYGCPVDTSCNEKGSGVSPPGFQTEEVHLKKEIDWDYVSAALGFAVALGSTVWLTLHCKRWREMFFGKVDQIYLKFFPRC
ncbi:Leucine-rich repeat protein [Handroanthus impetiginosus]|uniref:Leucine-rich repeat protein n=1 Tax=Handroanthus impetiginosus TaxID=429701 RepID=A0A2G9G8Z5_9LAMI|nr:Leucine-rich repeat protein [Handroanthus impetiginosus]